MSAITLPEHLVRRIEEIAESEHRTIPEVVEAMLDFYSEDDPQLQLHPHTGGWALQWAGSSHPLQIFATHEDGLAAARQLSQQENGVLYIYGADGSLVQVEDPEDDLPLKPEIQERLRQLDAGEAKLISSEEVKRRLGLHG